VLELLRQAFKPEFLNRLDEIIIFNNLSREHLKIIVDIQLALLRKRLAERKLALDLTPEALEFIVNHGYDPVYGARPLKRAIQRHIQDGLAMSILEGKFKEGDTIKVAVTKNGTGLLFEKK
jgi:ATP-dependent Clp protease ATP-binding subunit ClpB